MSSYFFFDNLNVKEPEKLDEYVQKVAPIVEKFGGKYRIVGGRSTIFEGGWQPVYPVIIKFENAEKARAWYESDDYQPLRALRQSAVECNAVLIDDSQ